MGERIHRSDHTLNAAPPKFFHDTFASAADGNDALELAEAVADAESAATEFGGIGDDGDAPGDAYEYVIGAEARNCIDLRRAVWPGTNLITPQAIRAPAFPAGSD